MEKIFSSEAGSADSASPGPGKGLEGAPLFEAPRSSPRQASALCGDALEREMIVANPAFFTVGQKIALRLLCMHMLSPRTARLVASHRKWLITQTLFALSMRAQDVGGATGLTPGELAHALRGKVQINRKTLSHYLAELEAYGFLQSVRFTADGRRKLFEATPRARRDMRSWYDAHLVCLDLLDDGNRSAISMRCPALVFRAQPKMIARILSDSEWLDPPPSIASFINSDTGGMLVQYLISKLQAPTPIEGRFLLDEISTVALAERFAISLSNVKRMVRRAEEAGCIGWERPRRRGRLWVAPQFVADHFRREAIKCEMIDCAFRDALDEIS